MPTRAEHQAGLNAMPSAAEVAGTESLDNGLAVEALIFPAYPIGKHHVQVVHNFDKLGLAKLVVVIVPTSHLALNLYPHLLEFPVKMGMQLPLFHLLMQLLHRFLADGGEKAREALTLLYYMLVNEKNI